MAANIEFAEIGNQIAPVASKWILSQGEGEWFDTIPGETLRVRVYSRDVQGRYTILESVAQPMAGSPMHTHREDEIFHILEGVLTFEVNGHRIEGGPGSFVVVPAGAVHAWRNLGDRPARCVVFLTPGGIEELFMQIRHVPPEELADLAARYGSIVCGPPIER